MNHKPKIYDLFTRKMSAAQIEAESLALIEKQRPPAAFDDLQWRIVRRMIHAAGDFGIARDVCFSAGAVEIGLKALRSGCHIFADSNMIKAGISLKRLRAVWPAYERKRIICHVADADVAAEARGRGLPRAIFAVRKAKFFLEGSIAAFGNSPTALMELSRMIIEEGVRPALVLAMPVGFVHVNESKAELMALNVPFIGLRGNRGGSPLAVSAIHALAGLAMQVYAENFDCPVIVLVAFGALSEEARKVYAHIGARVKERYPKNEIRWAYSAETIVKKLKAQGVKCQTLEEVLDDLRGEKRPAAVLQSLHIVPGEEFESIRKANASNLSIAIGQPLLNSPADMQAVLKALAPEISRNVPTVIAMHGNAKHPEFNCRLLEFAKAVEGSYSNVVVASVEGNPGLEPLKLIRSQVKKTGRAHFVPLMLTAGSHVRNDIFGDNPQSWKNMLGARQATCAASLGYNDAVLVVFFEHLDQALRELERRQKGGGQCV